MMRKRYAALGFGLLAIFAACSSGSTSDADSSDASSDDDRSSDGDGDSSDDDSSDSDSSDDDGSSTGSTSSGSASSDDSDAAGGSVSSGGATSSGGANLGGASMGGMAGSPGMPDELPSDVIFFFDPNKDAEAAVCATKQLEATEVLLDMFIILDQSGSMTEGGAPMAADCAFAGTDEGSRWCNAVVALDGFFGDPSSVGMGVAYAEFADDSCEEFVEMDVPFGVIEAGDGNGHLAALRVALADDNPTNGYTATEGAVLTLIDQTKTHVPAESRKAVTILVTDGEPTRCLDMLEPMEEMMELNALLADHYQMNDVPSFIIGMDGAEGDLLEALALGAGSNLHTNNCLPGADECSYFSVGDGDPAVFIDALESIRTLAVGCEYTVPDADIGVSILDTLEVKYTQSVGAEVETLERVGAEADCSSATQYWIDTSAEDAVVKLCPATCDRRGEETAIDLALVCEGT